MASPLNASCATSSVCTTHEHHLGNGAAAAIFSTEDDVLTEFPDFHKSVRREHKASFVQSGVRSAGLRKTVIKKTAQSGSQTRDSLLVALRRRENIEAWEEFCRTYEPLVYQFLRRRISEADARDVLQDVYVDFLKIVERFRYQTQQGSFRGYLFRITRNCLSRHLGRKKRMNVRGGSTMQVVMNNLPAVSNEQAEWDRLAERHLFLRAIEQVRRDFTHKVFAAWELTAVQRIPAARVAQRLQISMNSLYTSRHRVAARVRKVIEGLQ